MPELRTYQQEDVAKLITREAMGVFNEQRTGKTPTSIMATQQQGVQRLLIVCPASLVYAWKYEFERWAYKEAVVIDSASHFTQHTTDFIKPAPAALIINYENLRDNGNNKGAWDRILKHYKPDGLIVDEAHRCKTRDSKNFTAIKKFKHVPYRLYLTGTPAPNKPWDVWTILHLIDPISYSSYWNFIDEYFRQGHKFVGQEHIVKTISGFRIGMDVQLQSELNKLSIMRKRADVMPWLPKIDAPVKIKLPCTALQTKYIKELEDYFETENVVTQSVLEQLIRVRQICGAPAMLGLKGNSPKIDWIKQYIKDYPDKSIVIFSNSKRLIYLVKAYVKCVVITGDVPPKERQQHIVSFQNGTTRVIILQTQAGKEGLTLDNADVTIFLDTYPPAADYLQARDRMVATVPEHVKPQSIIHLMMKGTYDEHLYQLVEQGISDTDVINDYINYIKGRRITNG
jgi:SNF2 family DNA or RNA helicase